MLGSSGGHEAQSVMEKVGDNIIHHVSNSDIHHPIIHLPHLFNVDMSVTKHVLMLWIVLVSVALFVILPVQQFIKKKSMVPSGLINLLEIIMLLLNQGLLNNQFPKIICNKNNKNNRIKMFKVKIEKPQPSEEVRRARQDGLIFHGCSKPRMVATIQNCFRTWTSN